MDVNVDFDLGRLSDLMLETMVETSRGGKDPGSRLTLAIRGALVEEQLRRARGTPAHARTFSLPSFDSAETLEALGGVKVNMEDFNRHASELRDGFSFLESLAVALKSRADAIEAGRALAN